MRGLQVAAAIVLLGLAGCNETVTAPPKTKPSSEQDLDFAEGGKVSVAVFRNKVGCEWLVFRYRGYNMSAEPNMEDAGGGQRRQICHTVEKASTSNQ